MAEYRVEIRRGFGDQHLVGQGVLTDEHPVSSYGLPVVVVNGIPRGSGEIDGTLYILDLPEHTAAIARGDSAAVVAGCRQREAMERRAEMAGYHLSYGLPQ
jgi:hypothetical protein